MSRKQTIKVSEESIKQAFGKNLRKKLIDKDLTQQDLAELVGTSPLVVTRWCNGGAIPQPRMLARICNSIAVRPFELMRDLAG
jgi:transcriptional regulator with XRE-family HTH domain